MFLWKKWFQVVWQLRNSCSHGRTFLWMVTVIAAFSIRDDLAGVTSFIRCLGLQGDCYHLVLNFFHSTAVNLSELTKKWIQLSTSIFSNCIQTQNGRIICLADGIKISKEGKKMPAVKSLHQESQNNSKPNFIMGHYFECISLLIGKFGQFFAVPWVAKIHGGVLFSEDDKNQTLLDRFIRLVHSTTNQPCCVVADAYYAAKKVMIALTEYGFHLVTRMRTNAVAWKPAISNKKNHKKKGRPKTYGKKIILRKFFGKLHLFITANSPVYGETKIKIKYLTLDLLLRPFSIEVRIVIVIHPTRGKIFLLSTDRSLCALEIIKMYGYRFKIEVAFKQAVKTLGVFAHHFWMSNMQKIKRHSGDQEIYKMSKKYQEQVKRKIKAYELYVQLGLIAQGLLIFLSVTYKSTVWNFFRSWLRTMNTNNCPSELVVSEALRSTFQTFLYKLPKGHIWKKFIKQKTDFSRLTGSKLAA